MPLKMRDIPLTLDRNEIALLLRAIDREERRTRQHAKRYKWKPHELRESIAEIQTIIDKLESALQGVN